MRLPRWSIGRLMGFVVVAALALAALRYPTWPTAGVVFLITCGTLALAVVGASCRRGTAHLAASRQDDCHVGALTKRRRRTNGAHFQQRQHQREPAHPSL